MREIPPVPMEPWHPPAYEVDAAGRVVGAQPGPVHNWGRWGDHDERGTLNLLTPDRVAAATACVLTGERFDLGLPIGAPPVLGFRPQPLHLFSATTGDYVLGAQRVCHSDDYIVMALQASTQVDGLCHLSDGAVLYNGFWAGAVTAYTGARRLGVHWMSNGIVGRGVLLDVARHVGRDPLEPAFAIGPDLLDEVAAAQGVEARPADILLVRTGTVGGYLGGQPWEGRNEAGLSPRCLPWLRRHDIAFVAVDNSMAEVQPGEPDQPALGLHVGCLRDLGLPLGELFDLDPLAAACAADGRYDGLFVAMPLPVVAGAGSPINPVLIR